MKKLFILLTLIFCVGSLSISSFTIVTAQKKKPSSKKTRPISTPTPEEKIGIENLSLEKSIVYAWCPFLKDKKNLGCSKDSVNLKVSTVAKMSLNQNLKYYYLVSGGRIIGEGSNVVWDLFGKPPGTYSITVGVGSSNVIFGNIVTKTVKVEECPECDIVCECPTVSITGPEAAVKAGDTVVFTANVSGAPQEPLKYKWSVSDGTIVSGEGTETIFVKTPINKETITLTVVVEISWVCEECPKSASTSISVSGDKKY